MKKCQNATETKTVRIDRSKRSEITKLKVHPLFQPSRKEIPREILQIKKSTVCRFSKRYKTLVSLVVIRFILVGVFVPFRRASAFCLFQQNNQFDKNVEICLTDKNIVRPEWPETTKRFNTSGIKKSHNLLFDPIYKNLSLLIFQ